jgi:hypothetical protein
MLVAMARRRKQSERLPDMVGQDRFTSSWIDSYGIRSGRYRENTLNMRK